MSLIKNGRAILALASVWLAGCGGVDDAVVRSISGTTKLGPEWAVFTMAQPLEVQRVGQRIRMKLPGVNDWAKPEGLILPDGSSVVIHVELLDQSGQRFTLVPVSIGAYTGFGLAQPEEGAGFLKNRRFTEVRIRSSKPILVQEIDWYCWTGK
ncbi:MAG: hypothetical protein IPI58_07235 [Alphaproteobacteria bacterium]|nr:MAG: hypothetical protein IPI58_07235 [Alphaproteobacteria bacterium]